MLFEKIFFAELVKKERERVGERETERERDIYIYRNIFIYILSKRYIFISYVNKQIYIYICIYFNIYI